MRRTATLIVVATMLLAAMLAAGARPGHHARRASHAAHMPAANAVPKEYNQFLTVHEFQESKRAPGTPVSIQGYIVTGYRAPSGELRLYLTDSVDRVLSAEDALKSQDGAAMMVVPAGRVPKSGVGAWTRKGLLRFVMYTGKGHPQILIHDIVEKMRITGSVGHTRGTLDPVSGIEYTDENGYWKKL